MLNKDTQTHSHAITPFAPPSPHALPKVTGEASSDNRLALMASVTNAGRSVEPQSLACAVDVTPGDVGGGPLGSTVLIEQVKRAGALAKVTCTCWRHPRFTNVMHCKRDKRLRPHPIARFVELSRILHGMAGPKLSVWQNTLTLPQCGGTL